LLGEFDETSVVSMLAILNAGFQKKNSPEIGKHKRETRFPNLEDEHEKCYLNF